jgi:hypothetical protein
VADPKVDRSELEGALEARRELGSEYEPQVIDSFVERIERRLAERAERRPVRRYSGHDDRALALAIVSLGVAIPLTAIAVTQAGLVGLVIVWIGIVLVNVAYSQRP